MDLREYKATLGLSIASPNLSYDELVAKVLKRTTAEKKGKAPGTGARPSLFSGLKEAFFRKAALEKPDKVSTAAPTPPPPSVTAPVSAPSPAPAPSLTPPNPIPPLSTPFPSSSTSSPPSDYAPPTSQSRPAPTVLDLSESDEDLGRILDNIIGETSFEIEAVPVAAKSVIEKQSETQEFEVTVDFDEEHENAEDGGSSSPVDVIFEEDVPQSSPAPHLSEAHQPAGTAVIVETVSITPQQEFAPKNGAAAALAVEVPARAEPLSEVDSLFESCMEELKSSANTQELEFGAHHFQTSLRRGDIDVLFDMAYESFEKPEVEWLLDSSPGVSTEKKIESRMLAKQLAEVEKEIKTPVMSLKRAKSAGDEFAAEEPGHAGALPAPIPNAPLFKQVLATGIDFVFLLVCAFLFSSAAILALHVKNSATLDLFESLNLIRLTHLALWSFIAGTVIYPLFALLFFRTTLGMAYAGLRITAERGGELSSASIIVRAILFPFSLLLGGCLPIGMGRRALHDYFAGTAITFD